MELVSNRGGSVCLDGQDWQLRWADGQRGGRAHHASEYYDAVKWMPATVPGEVHQELIKLGLLEEPTIGLNSLHARWVEESFWSYRRVFTLPEEAAGQRVWLRFEGLDYDATIYVNGKLVGKHANYYLPCRLEVTSAIQEGDNVLTVTLSSGLHSVAEKPLEPYYVTAMEAEQLTKRMWLRKPQSSFSWDWSPRLLNVGIHQSVFLEWADRVMIHNIAIRSGVSEDYSEGSVTASILLSNLQEGEADLAVRIHLEDGGLQFERVFQVGSGEQRVELQVEVANPELWWPVGQGEQRLYKVNVEVWAGGQLLNSREQQIGFRSIRINQSKHPRRGRYFILEVNGRAVFAKGANLVPADIIFTRIDTPRYERLIELALEAGMNLLRVWGGGLYESDEFYALCDRMGILVWQDFMFACANYPAQDAAFLASVKEEVRFQIRRLAGHPSLAMWCGNNEVEALTFGRAEGFIDTDYALFHKVIPGILQQEDPDRYYHPTSPYSPDSPNPWDSQEGDQHPWGVGFQNVDFRQYRDMECRFPNEGGLLGSTSLPTMHACLTEGQQYPGSFSWIYHDNSVEQWYERPSPDRIIEEWLGIDPRRMTVEQFCYYAGALQGEALTAYIDNFRRRKYDCAAAVFWMFNDCWPATRSWTVVDYYLRRTPSFYPVKRAFAPIRLVLTLEQSRVVIYGVNDTMEPLQGSLSYGIMTWDGDRPYMEETSVLLQPNASTILASFDAAAWEQEGGLSSAAHATLLNEGTIAARNRLILPLYRELQWPSPKVEVTREDGFISFTSDNFAWAVCIDLDGEEELPDNFFDVWPGIPYRMVWPVERELPQIRYVGNAAPQ
ncbi:glycoside hydrolase family 2 protein [Paenibacillus sp. GCM10023252]|uniref:beta-mannosidase n=1 Tax=Paenibacillus sp. GCM10023252 TaxID=3252649 RepID=UPI0036187FBA